MSKSTLKNWEKLVQAALRRGHAAVGDGRISSGGIAGTVPVSLKRKTNIDAILEAADHLQAHNPTVARILCEQAYTMAQNLDPHSDGKGVLQFKTGLMTIIKQKLLIKGGKQIDRSRDVELLWEFYQQYKAQHRVDDIQKEEHKWTGSGNLSTSHGDLGRRYSEMRNVISILRALVEVMEALSNAAMNNEDHSLASEVHSLIEAELRRIKKSDAVLAEQLLPFNILPLDTPSLTNATSLFPEVKAAKSSIRYFADLPRLPTSFNTSGLRDPDIFDMLGFVFGFQKDNVRNQRENVVLTIANAESQLGIPIEADPKVSDGAVNNVFLKVLDNYIKWCRYLQIRAAYDSVESLSRERKIILVSLYFCTWGEAANVRFLPECICYIFHHMAGELCLMLNHGEVTNSKGCTGEDGSVSFLEQVICPIYDTLSAEAANNLNGKAAHSEWRNYDDFNEFFWSSSCFSLSWPLKKDSSFLMKPRPKKKMGKSIFVEHRTFLHLFRSFHRMWIFLVVMFQALSILAFNEGKFTFKTIKQMLSVGPTYVIMNFIKSFLDVLLMSGAFKTARTFAILRIVIRLSLSCLSSILVTYLYVRVLKDQNKTTSSTAFQIYMLTMGTYALLRLVLALLLKFPFFRQLSEKCDQSIFQFIKWIYQERHYVGIGLYEKPADYIRYVFFWLVVLTCKFAFAYFLLIEPLADSTKLIVKIRGLQYSWHSFLSQGHHNLGSIVSLWAPVVSIYLMDIHIWYTVLSALVGGVTGARARLGEIRTIPLLRKRFETFPEAFFKNLVSSETKRLHFDKIFPEVSQDYKKLYAVIFSPMWNEIIKSLREEDYISNREMDLLNMPSNTGNLRFVQWPLFLISNKISLAIDYAKESQDAQADIWSRICKDKYMTYAIQESYYSIEMILKCLVDGEARLRIERIFREINSSILEGSLSLTLSLKKLPSVLSRFTALTGLLIQGENDGAVNAMRDFYEVIIHEFLATDLREQHEMSSNSQHSNRLFSKINPLNHEVMELVKRMHLLLTVKDSSANVPKNLEARRRLEFFTNSLFMDLPQAKPVCEMIPFSVFTPYFKETVLFSLSELRKENEDGISVLFYLKTVFKVPPEFDFFQRDALSIKIEELLHPTPKTKYLASLVIKLDEWINFTERVKRPDIGEAKLDENSEHALELRFWASYRGQTLARTVRGMMYYRRAIMLQSSLERFLENDPSKIKLRLTQDYEPSLQEKAQADIKFTYVVSCQIYGKQKEDKTVQAADIALLLQRNEALRVAFIHEEDIKTADGKVSKEYFSKLVKADEHGTDQEIYSVKLPGNPKLGEGKPENQNHAIIFTRGEAIQTIDMNQDNYLEEAMKMRNLLEEFRGNHGLRHPTILGVREHVFTGSVSSLAAFMSHQEGSFVTLGQRVLAKPLKVRMHYGHPDVFDRIFHITRGGISKASRVINISEDIFAGFNSTLRQGNITHHEYIQVGKGRDVGLNQIAIFEGKVAGGNGEQVLSRDVYRIGQHFDFFRMLSFYFTTVGYYVCTMVTVLTVYIFLYGRVYLALSGLDEGLLNGAKIANNKALDTVLNAQFLVQIGVFTAVPMIVCFILESGMLKGLFSFSVMQLQLCSVFFAFSLLTRTHYFGRTILHGGAKYQETGRGFVIRHINFCENYRTYSRSHFVKGLEVALLLIIYMAYGYREGDNTIYILVMISSWFPVISWLFAPFIFNPSGFEWQKTVDDFEEFMHWLFYKGGVGVVGKKSWEMWWEEEQVHIRTLRGRILETILSLRFFIFQYGIVYKLHLTGDDRRLVIYGFSWIVLLVVSMIFKLFTLSAKKSATLPLSIRLLQGVAALVLAPTLVVLVRFTDLTVSDLFATALAFLPTGWGILSLAIAWRPYIRRLGLWDFVKEFARAYEAGMGMIIFVPVAICSWFPFVSTFQSRMLFNQAFSRGLEMSLILAGNKANAQIVV